LIRHLVERHAVHWVNTIGTRPPAFNLDTLGRGWEKLRQWTRPGRPSQALPANLHVHNPRMWPWLRSGFDRWLNRRLLTRQLIRSLPGHDDVVALTTLPIVADLMGPLPVRRWVYYCVDDFGVWPGLDGESLRRLEEVVVRRADVLLAVSDTLQEKLAGMGRQAHLLTHGVDLAFWQTPADPAPLPWLRGLPRPRVVFWGLIDRRMDVTWVRRLAEAMPVGTILLVGPEADPDPALFASDRVRRGGVLPMDDLPRLAAQADVLIMPYADLPVTRAMQPLKLKEYLATGKPAVVSDLPATRPWGDGADLAADPDQFTRLVLERLRTGLPEAQRLARRRLAEEGWQAKAQSLERWLFPAEAAADASRSA
jgi:glycosyltransferase involved in cell wall biosynthesis